MKPVERLQIANSRFAERCISAVLCLSLLLSLSLGPFLSPGDCRAEDGPKRPEWLHLRDSVAVPAWLSDISSSDTMDWICNNQKRSIRGRELIAYGGGTAPARVGAMLLTDGSCLAGKLTQIDSNKVTWDSRHWGEVQVPRPWVRGIVMQPIGDLADWEKMKAELREDRGTKDGLLVEELGWVEGLIELESEGGPNLGAPEPGRGLPFFNNGKSNIPWSRIRAIRFSPALTPMIVDSDAIMLWQLWEGEELRIRSWRVLDDKMLEVQLGVPLNLVSLMPTSKIAKRMSGMRNLSAEVRWLADETPASYKHVPQFAARMPLGQGKTIWGDPIVFHQTVRSQSLAMASSSQATFKHDGSDQRFKTEVARGTSSWRQGYAAGDVIAKVLVSRGGPLETVYESPLIHADESFCAEVDLKGCRLVMLLVEAANAGQFEDQLYWLDCRIEGK